MAGHITSERPTPLYDDVMAVGSTRLHTRRALDHVFDLTEIQDKH